MIGRRQTRKSEEEVVKPRSFDDFDLKLGDMMRGERATMGKSLLDVQRELRIKASYIAAIENSDPSAFDTPGFIAGYVRSYARYLNMDPDHAFEAFCAESGFAVAHGMSAEASVVKKKGGREDRPVKAGFESDPFARPGTPFAPAQDAIWSQIEPRAIGSSLVLLLLIGGLGYGGWSVLREVQQVQVTPVDQTPVVLSDLDPLAGASRLNDPEAESGFSAPSAEALDRLYRPQALDVPVMVARDAPISTLDPRNVGTLSAADLPDVAATQTARFDDGGISASTVPRVVEDAAPSLRMVAVRPAWVRVRAADGTVVFEATMSAGQAYEVPATEEPATLRVGESGAIYFEMNGQHFGPVGPRGTVTSNVALSIDNVTESFALADLEQDRDLARMVAEAAAVPQE